MLTKVAAVVFDGVSPFELGVVCEAWGVDRTANGVPALDFAICAARPGRVATSMGFGLDVDDDLSRAESADLVCVPAIHRDWPAPGEVLGVLRGAVARGARVLSVCSGAFVLGEAGLLDGRRCTTH